MVLEERKFIKPWHSEAVKLLLNGLTVTDTAFRLKRSRATVHRFISSQIYETVKAQIVNFDAKRDIPSVAVATNNQILEEKRLERIRLAWAAVDEALRSDEVSSAMKAKIAIEVLKGHGELTEKIQHDHKHLGIMLLQGNQTPEDWENEADIEALQEEEIEADFSLVEE